MGLKFDIPYLRDAVIETDRSRNWIDFAVPPRHPKYFIEVKTRLVASSLANLSWRYEKVKSEWQAETILISNLQESSEQALKIAKQYWDFVVDFQELDKLKEIIKIKS